uniref:Uncharacterized protein n=1 Tax=Rhabditophanes sp. KR3021 TaxID=114890 RepID=A0AC35U1E8_9BILA
MRPILIFCFISFATATDEEAIYKSVKKYQSFWHELPRDHQRYQRYCDLRKNNTECDMDCHNIECGGDTIDCHFVAKKTYSQKSCEEFAPLLGLLSRRQCFEYPKNCTRTDCAQTLSKFYYSFGNISMHLDHFTKAVICSATYQQYFNLSFSLSFTASIYGRIHQTQFEDLQGDYNFGVSEYDFANNFHEHGENYFFLNIKTQIDDSFGEVGFTCPEREDCPKYTFTNYIISVDTRRLFQASIIIFVLAHLSLIIICWKLNIVSNLRANFRSYAYLNPYETN